MVFNACIAEGSGKEVIHPERKAGTEEGAANKEGTVVLKDEPK
jgi:hypothetical protein